MRLFGRRKPEPARAEGFNVEGRRGWGGSIRLFAPESKIDWANRAGRLYDNAVVGTGINWVQRNWPQAKVMVGTPGEDGPEPILGHRFLAALDEPTPGNDSTGLWDATALSMIVAGNAYWLALPRVGGDPAFFWLNHERVKPYPGEGTLVGHYEYTRVGDGKVFRFAPEQILHFRLGVDPIQQALGLSPLAALVREIAQDNMAATKNAALLNRMGTTGMVLSPKDGSVTMTDDQRRSFREQITEVYSADGAGRALMLPFPADVQYPNVSADSLMAKELQSVPTSRVLAALGLSAMALDLPSDNKTYSNYGEAVRACWDNCLIPIQDRCASVLTRFARRWYGSPELLVWFDRSDVPALQDDEDAKWKRVSVAYAAGVVSRAQALQELGLQYDEARDDVYVQEAADGLDGERRRVQQDAAKRARARIAAGEWPKDDD